MDGWLTSLGAKYGDKALDFYKNNLQEKVRNQISKVDGGETLAKLDAVKHSILALKKAKDGDLGQAAEIYRQHVKQPLRRRLMESHPDLVKAADKGRAIVGVAKAVRGGDYERAHKIYGNELQQDVRRALSPELLKQVDFAKSTVKVVNAVNENDHEKALGIYRNEMQQQVRYGIDPKILAHIDLAKDTVASEFANEGVEEGVKMYKGELQGRVHVLFKPEFEDGEATEPAARTKYGREYD